MFFNNRIGLLCFLLGIIGCSNLFYPYTSMEKGRQLSSQLMEYVHPFSMNDFSFLSNELQNKRIIILGEQLHQDGTTFRIKEQIIRYLHENLNFDVVLYEAGLFDMWQMINRKDSLDPNAGLYSFWWNNEETKSLLEYYRQQNQKGDSIFLNGFDIQLTGNIADSSRTKLLSNYLLKNGIKIENYLHFLFFAKDMQRYLRWWNIFKSRFTDEQKDSILQDMDDLVSKIQKNGKSNIEDQIYYRYLSGLKQWFETLIRYPKIGSPQRMQVRDSLMANNLIWLIDNIYPSKKVIIWMANMHAIHPENLYFPWKTTGQYLKTHYEENLYTVVFSSYGRLNNQGGLDNTMGNKSLEYLLHQESIPYAYIQAAQLPEHSFLKQKFVCGINQGLNQKADWFSMTDLYINIDTMRPLTAIKE